MSVVKDGGQPLGLSLTKAEAFTMCLGWNGLICSTLDYYIGIDGKKPSASESKFIILKKWYNLLYHFAKNGCGFLHNIVEVVKCM